MCCCIPRRILQITFISAQIYVVVIVCDVVGCCVEVVLVVGIVVVLIVVVVVGDDVSLSPLGVKGVGQLQCISLCARAGATAALRPAISPGKLGSGFGRPLPQGDK